MYNLIFNNYLVQIYEEQGDFKKRIEHFRASIDLTHFAINYDNLLILSWERLSDFCFEHYGFFSDERFGFVISNLQCLLLQSNNLAVTPRNVIF
jgi:hypothetical protein